MTLQFLSIARRSALPAAAYILSSAERNRRTTLCDAPGDEGAKSNAEKKLSPPQKNIHPAKAGFVGGGDDQGYFHGLFPKRQLWQPKVEYPFWDHDWDGQREPPTGDEDVDKQRARRLRKTGVTRHIILIRHGQYDETHKEDERRILTPLGREQADLTGKFFSRASTTGWVLMPRGSTQFFIFFLLLLIYV